MENVERTLPALRNLRDHGVGKLQSSPRNTINRLSAAWKFRYRYDPGILTITSGEFETPTSRGSIDGILAPRNTMLNARFETGSLETYKDFIDRVRGAAPGSRRLQTHFRERAVGRQDRRRLRGTSFQGHLRGERPRYDGYSWISWKVT